jgi:hypothetical protein
MKIHVCMYFARHLSLTPPPAPSFFHTDGHGVSLAFGVTYDGINIDAASGLPLPTGLHNFSAASKEAIHIGMAAVALSGGSVRGVNATLAQSFFGASAGSRDPIGACGFNAC